MSVRVALGVLLVHVATMFGVLVAGGTPEQCEESRKPALRDSPFRLR